MKMPNETETFRPVNLNPSNRRAGDCVVRAIAGAMGLEWRQVYDYLYGVGRKYGYMLNDKQTYGRWLAWNKKEMLPQPRHLDGTKYTARQFLAWFADHYPRRNCVAHVGGHHLSAIVDGKWQDTWDVTRQDKCVGNFWVI